MGFDRRWHVGGGGARGERVTLAPAPAPGRGGWGVGGGGLRARGKCASDFSFILYFSNASDSLKVQDTSPEY